MVHGDFRQRKSSPSQAKRNGSASPPPLCHGQEYPERSHQHCHVEVEADVSYQANRQPDEMYENTRGLFFDEYVKAIKEAGNVWAVPVIDLNSLSGLFPLYDAGAQMFNKPDTDRLHPNDAGHSRMAKTIMQQLSALPCVF